MRTEPLEQRSLLERHQIRRDDRRNRHEASSSHARYQSTDEERHHRRREAAQGGPAREERQGEQEGVAPTDDVGESAIEGGKSRGAQEVAGSEQAGLIRLFERGRDVRDQGRDLRSGCLGERFLSELEDLRDSRWFHRGLPTVREGQGQLKATLNPQNSCMCALLTKTPNQTATKMAFRFRLGSLVGSSK